MRIIAHLDMDAFFAAIEERDRPRLWGLPIVVGADPRGGQGRGVVSTANYKAREYGIRSAIPISTAWRFSEEAKRAGKPPVVFLEPNFRKYSEVSESIISMIKKRLLAFSAIAKNANTSTPLVEQASVDEAYFDLSFAGSFDAAQKMCEKIKKEIKEREKLTCSIGVGPNKLIAKIASDIQKPDGLTIVTEAEMEKFLEPLPIRKIPGIGPKTEAMFKKMSAGGAAPAKVLDGWQGSAYSSRGGSTSGGGEKIEKVADLKKFSQDELKKLLGKWGADLYEKIRGRDDSPIVEEYEVKSIGEQETFEKDSRDPSFIAGRLKALCENVFRRFSSSGFSSFRTIVVTVRFADFSTKNRSRTFPESSDFKKILEFESLKLLMPFFDKRENPKKKSIRLLGVRIEKLVP